MANDEGILERQPLLQNNSHSLPSTYDASSNPSNPAESITWQSETTLITRHSLPLIGTYLLQYLYNLVIVLVSSRLSTEELAAVSLGIATSNIVGFAIFEGLATALDTLCAQAYGSGHLQLVGVHMLRFTVFIHLVAVPIGALWLASPWIMPYLVPGSQLAGHASTFLQWSLIGLPGYATFEAGKRFMQAQGNFTSGLLVLIACLPINVFLNWLLVFHLDLRIAGAAMAAGLTNLVRPFLLFTYATCINRVTLQCWPSSISWRLLWTNWEPMVQLAIPGAIMALSEWMAFAILTFATSYAGTVDLAAQTFLGTSAIVVWHVHFAGSVVTSTRLGQLVGGGHLQAAKTVSRYYVYIFIAAGVLDMLCLFGLLEIVIHFLELEQAVQAAVIASMPFAIIFTFWDCMATCMHGIVRGIGWQSIGGWVTVLCNYLYGVPLALFLELGLPGLGLRGLWMAIASCLAMIAIVEGLVVRARSWDKVVEEAGERQRS